MGRVRATVRLVALIFVTALAALPPAVLRRIRARRARLLVGSRCCRLWGRAACAIMGIRRTVEGRPSGGVFVVASNHLSYADILVLSSIYPSLFVAKREIASWPVFGWVTRNCGTLFVDRERTRDVVRIGRAMSRYLEQGVPLTLFPEGKATRGAEVLPFLPSLLEPAARSGVPCFAASLTYEIPGSRSVPSETVCWHSGAAFVPHVWRLLQFRRIDVEVRFSDEPIRSADRKKLAASLHDAVVKKFSTVRQQPRAGESSERPDAAAPASDDARRRRLEVAAALVPRGSRVADIGTDHGLLPALLLESRRASFCIASDRSREVLGRIAPAAERLARSGRLELRHADGLRALRPEDRIDVVVMAGLGARSMIGVLEAHEPTCRELRRLVLEPRTEIGSLRRWLDERGFGIVDERVVVERGRYYFLVAAEPGAPRDGFEHPGLSREDLYEAGPVLVRSESGQIRNFWRRQLSFEESLLQRPAPGPAHAETIERRDRARRVLGALEGKPRAGKQVEAF